MVWIRSQIQLMAQARDQTNTWNTVVHLLQRLLQLVCKVSNRPQAQVMESRQLGMAAQASGSVFVVRDIDSQLASAAVGTKAIY